jgi:hypothetical protein
MLAILNKISCEHNNCEDSYYVREDDKVIQGIISDGCSTGKDSHFASKLICNAFKADYLRLEGLELNLYYEFSDSNTLQEVLKSCIQLQSDLCLEDKELWGTVVVFDYHKEYKELQVRVLGDGVYYVNGEEFNVSQNDRVDYFVNNFPKGQDLYESAVKYVEKYPRQIYSNVESFRVSTDGIHSLKLLASKDHPIGISYAKDLLLSSNNSSNHLQRKYNILKKEGFVNTDDLTIISYDETI